VPAILAFFFRLPKQQRHNSASGDDFSFACPQVNGMMLAITMFGNGHAGRRFSMLAVFALLSLVGMAGWGQVRSWPGSAFPAAVPRLGHSSVCPPCGERPARERSFSYVSASWVLSGPVKFYNNRMPSGELVRAFDPSVHKVFKQLEDQVEDARTPAILRL
jgi:hypothetical protein